MRLRRALARVAVVLGGLLAGAAVAFVATSKPGDPRLFPPPAGAGAHAVAVVDHGYHAGLVLTREPLQTVARDHGLAALLAVTVRFADYRSLELGWGDEGFYRHVPDLGALTLGIALRALFGRDNPSVLHVVGLSREPAQLFGSERVVALALSDEGLLRLAHRLDATFARGTDGGPIELGIGIYGPSLFYRATDAYHVANTCNHWLARLLNAAGVPVSMFAATTSTGLVTELRLRTDRLPGRA